MKKQKIFQWFVNGAVILGLLFATFIFVVPEKLQAYGDYFWTVYVRNAIVDYGTLAVTGTSTFTGAVTFVGATNYSGGGALSLNGTLTDTSRFIADKANGRARLTVGSTAGTGAGRLYAGDSIYVATTLFADASRNVAIGTITGAQLLTDVLNGRARVTVGTSAGTGAGRLFAGDSIYVASTLFADASRNVSVGTITGTRFLSDAADGRARATVGTSAGTGAGKLYAGDSVYVATTLFVDANRNVSVGTITGAQLITDVANGRARATVGAAAGTGAGRLYAGDSIYVATSLFVDSSRNISVGTVTGSYAISDVSGGTPRFTVGTSAGTGLGKTYLDSLYIGTTLFCDNSRNLSTGTITAGGKVTLAAGGVNYALHTIAAGDSVFLHEIVDAADTTLKVWNGSAWISIKDLIP